MSNDRTGDGDLEPIVVDTVVPASPQEAFVAFTARMDEWWDVMLTPDAATFSGIEIDPGGEVAMRHGDERHVWGRVTTWEPGEVYAQDFWLGHDSAHPTTLRVTFREEDAASEGDSTRVRIEHGGWSGATAQVRARYTHWRDLIERFAAYVAR